MPVRHIDHVNLRASADDLARLRDFYCGALGLTPGARPDFESSGTWLYADGLPIVHLVEAPVAAPRTEAADAIVAPRVALGHLAFRCSGLKATVERLIEHGVPYDITVAPSGEMQILVQDPDGMNIELVFSAREQIR
jgi:catechol 2,3-dioxygenase-like lactoylglutathione lyase family enzyme